MAKQDDVLAHEKGLKPGAANTPITARAEDGLVEIQITTDRAGLGGRGAKMRVSPARAERWQHRNYAKIIDKGFLAAVTRKQAAIEAEREAAGQPAKDPVTSGEVETPPRDLPDADGRGGKNQE